MSTFGVKETWVEHLAMSANDQSGRDAIKDNKVWNPCGLDLAKCILSEQFDTDSSDGWDADRCDFGFCDVS
jgi:hypothetical protein